MEPTRWRGIRLSFYTPAYGEGSELWLRPAERDAALDEIARRRARYPEFVWMTDAEIEALRPARQDLVLGDGCTLKKGWDVSFDHRGVPKEPCVMGEKADCNRCGCTVPAMLHAAAKRKHSGTMSFLLGTFAD